MSSRMAGFGSGFFRSRISPTGSQAVAHFLHHLTTNVTGILTGCTLGLELVAVNVIV